MSVQSQLKFVNYPSPPFCDKTIKIEEQERDQETSAESALAQMRSMCYSPPTVPPKAAKFAELDVSEISYFGCIITAAGRDTLLDVVLKAPQTSTAFSTSVILQLITLSRSVSGKEEVLLPPYLAFQLIQIVARAATRTPYGTRKGRLYQLKLALQRPEYVYFAVNGNSYIRFTLPYTVITGIGIKLCGVGRCLMSIVTHTEHFSYKPIAMCKCCGADGYKPRQVCVNPVSYEDFPTESGTWSHKPFLFHDPIIPVDQRISSLISILRTVKSHSTTVETVQYKDSKFGLTRTMFPSVSQLPYMFAPRVSESFTISAMLSMDDVDRDVDRYYDFGCYVEGMEYEVMTEEIKPELCTEELFEC